MNDIDRPRRRFIVGSAGAIATVGLTSLTKTVSAREEKTSFPVADSKRKLATHEEKQPIIGMSHLGLCVSDLDRAVRFYTRALKAEELIMYELDKDMPSKYRDWMEIPADITTYSKFVAIDGFLLEFLYYTREGKAGGHIGPPVRRPMNQLGFTHLSLRIADVAEFKATLERVHEFGGHLIHNGHLFAGQFEGEPIELVFVTDPDGTRIELMRIPDRYPMGGTIYRPRKLELA